MHSNTTIGKSKGSGGRQGMLWRPLHKPEYFSVQKRVGDSLENFYFDMFHWWAFGLIKLDT